MGLDFIHNLNNGPVPGEYDTAKNHISVTGQGFPHADRVCFYTFSQISSDLARGQFTQWNPI